MSRKGERRYRHRNQWRTETRRQVLERDGYRCVMCGHPGSDGRGRGLQLAHIIDEADGGSNDASNLVTLCRSDHRIYDATKQAARRA